MNSRPDLAGSRRSAYRRAVVKSGRLLGGPSLANHESLADVGMKHPYRRYEEVVVN